MSFRALFIFLLILCHGLSAFAQEVLARKMQAELQFGLIDSVISSLEEVETAQEYALLAEAYYRVSNVDSCRWALAYANDEAVAHLLRSRLFALDHQADSACFYLTKYLRRDEKLARAKLLTDTAFVKIQNEPEWKSLWKTQWYQSDSIAQEFDNMLAMEKYPRLLDEIYALRNRSRYFLFEAKALYGLGQIDDALKVLSQATDTAALHFRWKLEVESEKGKKSLATAKEYHRRCNECLTGKALIVQSAAMLGDTELAGEYSKDYLQYYYMDTAVLNALAWMWYGQGTYLEALRYSNQSLNYAHENPSALLVRGQSFFDLKNYEYAFKNFSLYLDLQQGNAEVLRKMGLSLCEIGRIEWGCKQLEFAQFYGADVTVPLRQFCAQK